jgi:hypothetical protein
MSATVVEGAIRSQVNDGPVTIARLQPFEIEQITDEPPRTVGDLHRRRGGNRLTDRERDEIRRCTRDPDSLRWPRGTDE